MPLKNFDEIKIFQRKVAFLVLFGGIWIILGNFQGIIILRGGTQMLFVAVIPFDEWNTIFYDQELIAVILDRFVHH